MEKDLAAMEDDTSHMPERRGRQILTEMESKKILRNIGLNVTQPFLASSKRKAAQIAESIGFPVVLKAESPKIVHKSDVGGVKTGITDKKALYRAYQEISGKTKQIDGGVQITVQKMVEGGIETIIGVNRDPQFGHTIMFGIGGVWVELFKDVTFRVIPIDFVDAEEMITEIKGQGIFSGYRGMPPVNKARLQEILVRVSRFISENPQIEEMDLNPVFALPEEVIVADARMILQL